MEGEVLARIDRAARARGDRGALVGDLLVKAHERVFDQRASPAGRDHGVVDAVARGQLELCVLVHRLVGEAPRELVVDVVDVEALGAGVDERHVVDDAVPGTVRVGVGVALAVARLDPLVPGHAVDALLQRGIARVAQLVAHGGGEGVHPERVVDGAAVGPLDVRSPLIVRGIVQRDVGVQGLAGREPDGEVVAPAQVVLVGVGALGILVVVSRDVPAVLVGKDNLIGGRHVRNLDVSPLPRKGVVGVGEGVRDAAPGQRVGRRVLVAHHEAVGHLAAPRHAHGGVRVIEHVGRGSGAPPRHHAFLEGNRGASALDRGVEVGAWLVVELRRVAHAEGRRAGEGRVDEGAVAQAQLIGLGGKLVGVPADGGARLGDLHRGGRPERAAAHAAHRAHDHVLIRARRAEEVVVDASVLDYVRVFGRDCLVVLVLINGNKQHLRARELVDDREVLVGAGPPVAQGDGVVDDVTVVHVGERGALHNISLAGHLVVLLELHLAGKVVRDGVRGEILVHIARRDDELDVVCHREVLLLVVVRVDVRAQGLEGALDRSGHRKAQLLATLERKRTTVRRLPDAGVDGARGDVVAAGAQQGGKVLAGLGLDAVDAHVVGPLIVARDRERVLITVGLTVAGRDERIALTVNRRGHLLPAALEQLGPVDAQGELHPPLGGLVEHARQLLGPDVGVLAEAVLDAVALALRTREGEGAGVCERDRVVDVLAQIDGTVGGGLALGRDAQAPLVRLDLDGAIRRGRGRLAVVIVDLGVCRVLNLQRAAGLHPLKIRRKGLGVERDGDVAEGVLVRAHGRAVGVPIGERRGQCAPVIRVKDGVDALGHAVLIAVREGDDARGAGHDGGDARLAAVRRGEGDLVRAILKGLYDLRLPRHALGERDDVLDAIGADVVLAIPLLRPRSIFLCVVDSPDEVLGHGGPALAVADQLDAAGACGVLVDLELVALRGPGGVEVLLLGVGTGGRERLHPHHAALELGFGVGVADLAPHQQAAATRARRVVDGPDGDGDGRDALLKRELNAVGVRVDRGVAARLHAFELHGLAGLQVGELAALLGEVEEHAVGVARLHAPHRRVDLERVTGEQGVAARGCTLGPGDGRRGGVDREAKLRRGCVLSRTGDRQALGALHVLIEVGIGKRVFEARVAERTVADNDLRVRFLEQLLDLPRRGLAVHARECGAVGQGVGLEQLKFLWSVESNARQVARPEQGALADPHHGVGLPLDRELAGNGECGHLGVRDLGRAVDEHGLVLGGVEPVDGTLTVDRKVDVARVVRVPRVREARERCGERREGAGLHGQRRVRRERHAGGVGGDHVEARADVLDVAADDQLVAEITGTKGTGEARHVTRVVDERAHGATGVEGVAVDGGDGGGDDALEQRRAGDEDVLEGRAVICDLIRELHVNEHARIIKEVVYAVGERHARAKVDARQGAAPKRFGVDRNA